MCQTILTNTLRHYTQTDKHTTYAHTMDTYYIYKYGHTHTLHYTNRHTTHAHSLHTHIKHTTHIQTKQSDAHTNTFCEAIQHTSLTFAFPLIN